MNSLANICKQAQYRTQNGYFPFSKSVHGLYFILSLSRSQVEHSNINPAGGYMNKPKRIGCWAREFEQK